MGLDWIEFGDEKSSCCRSGAQVRRTRDQVRRTWLSLLGQRVLGAAHLVSGAAHHLQLAISRVLSRFKLYMTYLSCGGYRDLPGIVVLV